MSGIKLEGITKQGTVYKGTRTWKPMDDAYLYSLAVNRNGEGWRLISYPFQWGLADAELEAFVDGRN